VKSGCLDFELVRTRNEIAKGEMALFVDLCENRFAVSGDDPYADLRQGGVLDSVENVAFYQGTHAGGGLGE
jgi:hypothetical protein